MKDELEYMEVGRIKLTDRTLNEIANRVEERYGLDVLEIAQSSEGYVLKGKYGFTIGDITYNPSRGAYNSFNFHHGVKESIEAKDNAIRARKQNEKRRQYKLQRNIKIGTALTAAGLTALIGFGVIKAHFSNTPVTPETERPEIVAQVDHLNTLKSSNDLILVEWANYAMGGVSSECQNSEYEAVQSMRDDVYANIFVPVMSNYYNYLDMLDSGLPADIIGTSVENNHSTFRNSVYDFDEYLDGSFAKYTFQSSPYADAIVMDGQGNVINTSGSLQGELKDSEGQIITFDDTTASVYIKATSIPGQDFKLDSLPEDAVIYNGEAYVLSTHLTQTQDKNMNK